MVHAADRFVAMAKRLGLIISEKSVIVASSKRLSALVKSELAAVWGQGESSQWSKRHWNTLAWNQKEATRGAMGAG